MKITRLSEAPHVPVELEGYIMHSSDNMEIIHLCLKPGERVAPHKNSFDVIASLIAGEVKLITSGGEISLKLFDTVEIECDSERGFFNVGEHEARLLIIKKL